MKIAYLTSMYPDVSHTFILREVLALRSKGVELATFSVRRSDGRNVLGAEARKEAASTRWLVPPPVARLATAFVWSLATRPVLMGRVVLSAVLKRGMTVGRRCKWLCYFAEAVLLAYWLVTESFDHLHCHFGNNGSSTGMLAARLARIPFSLTIHGSELRDIEKHRLTEKVTCAAFVACVSKYGRAQLMLSCQPEHWDKLRIVRCGIPQVNDSNAVRSEGPARLLCVARLSLEKGHLVLLDALATLRDRGVDVQCTLVGDGPMRSAIEERAQELRLTASLTFTGSLEPKRVAQMYKSADAVVLASLSEGVPVVLMEAMARGRPVVATRVGGVPELVEDGRSGLVVAPGDADALADALLRVLNDPEWATTMGQNGARRVREEFHAETSASRLTHLFRHAHDSCVKRVGAASGKQASCLHQLTSPKS